MTEEINNISQIIRSTEEYSDVCDMCRDEILLYPTISGRTEYSQDEVEQITLKRIIDKLRAKEQECEELKNKLEKLKQKNEYLINTHIHFKNELKKYKKAVHKYKIVLLNKIKQLYLRRREFLEEINCNLTRIAYKDEEFKNVLDKFNNDIPVINNEDRYKQALDEIEEFCTVYSEDHDAYERVYKNILGFVNKAKENE